ncbi:carboxypeptidase regulatory-like domain-containing protein [Ilumatobacter fluminis]|nr:carboxypeptidase regulatory-like domain-containing protein [Ilumatobacter fluminis]
MRLIARVTAVAVVASTGAVITHQSVSAADPTIVQGVVTDMTVADGAEGVAVQVMTGAGVEQKPTTVAEVLSDEFGFYSIDVTAWDDEPLHLNVVDPTRRLGAEFFVPVALTPETTNTVNHDLDLGGVINGSVRTQDWWFIEDACATITNLSGDVVVPYEWIGTCSGEWGWFQLPALPPGEYLLDFGTPSPGEAYPVFDFAVTAVAGEQYWYDVIMPLPPNTTISAAVTDGTDPVDDMRIVAHTTDRNGEFRARDMEPTGEPGEYSVYLGGIGFGSEPFTVDALSTSPSLASDVGATIALQPGYDEAIGFTLQPGSYLEGEITGPDNEPVSGACVVLEDLTGEPVLRPDHAPCTDETGTFATYSVPAGTYQARIVAPDGLDSRVIGPFTITPGSPAFETIQLDEFPPTLIAGLVRDEVTEQPLPDVRVKVRGTDAYGQLFGQEVVTGADGLYELDLTMFELTGDALIVDAIDETGTHAASLMNEVYLQHGYTELIGFDLDAGGRFVGDVTDVSTGFALEGACVRVYDATGTTLAVPSDYSPCTGTDGRFETVGLAPGDYVLEFVAPFNYETLTTTAVTIVAGSDTEVDGELAPVVTGIEGLVVEQGTTTPIEGVTVAARVETADGEQWLTTSTDIDGEFAIDLSDDLPLSTVLLDAVDPDGDYASVFEVPLDVQQGYVELIEIGMEPGGTIEGTITTPAPDLLPIEGACVTVRNDVGDDVFPAHAPICSDENGDYATRGLPAGDYTLDVVPPSNVYLGTTDLPATITSGVTTLDLELEARPPATISGYVTDNADEPVFNARVRVRTEAGAVVAETYSDNSGFYIVTVAEGTYELVVGAPNGDGEFVPAEFYPFGETTKNIQVGAFTYPVSGELLLEGVPSLGWVSCGGAFGSAREEWVWDPVTETEDVVYVPYSFEVLPGSYECGVGFQGREGAADWNFVLRDTVPLEVSGPTTYDAAVDDVVDVTVSVVDGAGAPVSNVGEVSLSWNAPWVWDPVTETESYVGVPVAGTSLEVWRAEGMAWGESSPVFRVPDGLTGVEVRVNLENGLEFNETIDINGGGVAFLEIEVPDFETVSGELLLEGVPSLGWVSCGGAFGSAREEWVWDPVTETEDVVYVPYSFEVLPGSYECGVGFQGREGAADWNFVLRDTVPLEVSGPTTYDAAVDDVVDVTVSVVDGAGAPVSNVGEVSLSWNAPWVWDPVTETESYVGVPVAGTSLEVWRAEGMAWGESSPVFRVPDGLTGVEVRVNLENGLEFNETIDINGGGVAFLEIEVPDFETVSGELLLEGVPSLGWVSCGGAFGSAREEWVWDPVTETEDVVYVPYSFEVLPGSYECGVGFQGREGAADWNFVLRDTVPLEVSGPTTYDAAVDDVVDVTVSVVDGAGAPVSNVGEVSLSWNAPWVWDPVTETESYVGVPVAGTSLEVWRAEGMAWGESSPVFRVPDGLTGVEVRVNLENGLEFNETIDINGDTGAILYLIDPGIWFVGSSGDSFDDDNVDDITEALAPNQGDGNNDGFPDYDQNNVTSLPSYTGNYVTVEVENGKTFTNVRAVDPVADVTVETPVPSSYTLPEGLLDFRIDGLTPGETVDVIIYTESVEGVTGYAKYDRETKGWYQLPSELVDIVEFDPLHPNRGPHVIVSLTDGGVGDDDGAENGTIIDPGGLLIQSSTEGDDTPPVVTGTISPAPNVDGWNNTPASVSWVAVDAVSGATQPAPITVNDTGFTTVTSNDSCDESGNCAPGVVVVKIDTAAPTIEAIVTPAPNDAGWNNGPVTVSYDCVDDLSGVTFCSDADTVDGEGSDQQVIGFANDTAGNTVNATTSVNIDTTPPAITCGAPITVGRGSSSTLEASVDDALSGVASPTVDVPLDTSTVGTFSATVTATDLAGNPASTQCEYSVELGDDTPPTITATFDPEPNAAGWHTGDVEVSFECADDESGVATCPAPITFTDEGADQQHTVGATDEAGNAASTTVVVNIDRTEPDVTVLGVGDGPYAVSAPPTPTCSTTDALSGVATDASLVVTGGNEHGVGTFTASCVGAVDTAGNEGGASATYEVRYNRADGVFTGGPVVAWDPDDQVTNSGRRGRTYPMEWELYGADGGLVADLDAVESVIAYRSVDCDSPATNDLGGESTTLTQSLRLTDDGAFHLNWKSPKETGCFVLVISLDDASIIVARFRLR